MDIHVESDGKILGDLKSGTANIEGQSNSDTEIGGRNGCPNGENEN